VLGKLACAGGVREPGVRRLAVALGMLPRGEVQLIFAGIGAGLVLGGQPIVTPAAYSAVVAVVLVTTLLAPPLLKLALTGG
jgi:Kef-type K+ transport system membrane component KefB